MPTPEAKRESKNEGASQASGQAGSQAPSLTLRRDLKAPIGKVWRAWTDPEALRRWFFPADEIVFESVEVDLCVGGRWRIVGRMPDGERHRVGGSYREIVPQTRLVFSWAWESTPERESLVTVTLRQDGPLTRLTLTHDRFFDEAARDRHEGGWTGTLDRLGRVLAPVQHGRFHWNELMAKDVAQAKAFYATTLGWRFAEMPMAPEAKPYWLAFSGPSTVPVGGIFDISGPEFGGMADGWMPYIAVDDVDQRVAKAVAAGARLMKPLFDVPGVGRIAVLCEPGGAAVGWMTPAACI